MRFKKTLFIHIGTGKTGTTSIQKYLKENSEFINYKYNLNYCKSGRGDSINHRALDFNSVNNNLSSYKKVVANINLLINEINQHNSKYHLISDENFPGLNSREIELYKKKLGGKFNIKVIVYLRRQDKYLESWYKQVIKTGSYATDVNILFSQLFKRGILNYYDLVKSWADIFEKENVIVRLYEKNLLINQNVIDDILYAILNDCPAGTLNYKENLSLNASSIILIKKIFKKSWSKDLLNKEFIDNLLIKQTDSNVSVISEEMKDDILFKCSFFNRMLSNYYFNGKNIFR